ncbi:RNA-directed DNA polymerase, eukaryota, reverse transcriptase zinc-binding domain protein [Tanacetum coccineum]
MKKNVISENFAYRPKGNQFHGKHMDSSKEMQNASSQGKNTANGSKSDDKGKQSSNKFAVLKDYNDDDIGIRLNKEQKNEVDFFVNQKLQPTLFEISKWSHLMVNYFKDKWGMVLIRGQQIMMMKIFVYVVNHGKERIDLWKELTSQKQIINGRPWILLGDFNATLYSHEHSAGSSIISQDMQDFKDCVSRNELDDICSSEFQFTWTKSSSNPV